MSLAAMLLRVALMLALVWVLPTRAYAYETILTGPLHQGSQVVGQLEGARPSRMAFRDATHAEVTFATRSFEMRGSIDLAEGTARIRSEQHIVLSGSSFRIEVEPGVEVTLVDGLRHEVMLPSGMPLEGLDVTTLKLRVATEETSARDASLSCRPMHLWAAPRVRGPVLRTSQAAMLTHAPATGSPGWHEVWVREQGVWLRGYTWEFPRCGGFGRVGGYGYVTQRGSMPTRVTLPPQTRIGLAASAPWTVLVHEAMEVELADYGGGERYYLFAWNEGAARIAGVVLP